MRSPDIRTITTPRLRHALVAWSGTGIPVLLIHPNRTSHRVWDFMLSASQSTAPFFAPALRGHAGTDWPASGYCLEDHRDDLLALIATLGWSELIIVGQATGATLAMMAQPAVAIASAVNQLVQQQVRAASQFETREHARQALPFCERWSDSVIEHYLDHILQPHPKGGYQWNFSAEGVCETEAQLMRDVLPLIDYAGPALVFGGAQSTVLPPSMFERVARHLPGSSLDSLPNANHRLCQDNPAGFARMLDAFLSP
jgi:pimeloyl-ACP methyl ester carboxylesterase